MIVALTIAVALLGLVALGLLVRVGLVALRRGGLFRYRGQEEGMADLLVYGALIDDGVVLGKNGSLLAAYRYRCADSASSSNADREAVALRINQALQPLGNGWMIHVDALRTPAPRYGGRTRFPDPVTAAIDEERRTFFEGLGVLFESEFVLTVTYFPPTLAQSRFVELMFDDGRRTVDERARHRNVLANFQKELRALESRLSLAFELERLRAEEVPVEEGTTHKEALLGYLHYCVTGLRHPIALPRQPVYLDLLLGGQELRGGLLPQVGDKYIQVVAVEGFPLESQPGMLGALAELPCEYRWSTRFIFMDPHEAVEHLERYRKRWRQKVRGLLDQILDVGTGVVDQDALSMVEDAEEAIAEVNSGLITQGYYTNVIVLLDEDLDVLTRAAERARRVVTSLGFAAARIETINTLEAYLGSLPGHGVENVRRPLLNTFNLADMLPTSTTWAGASHAPCPMYPPNAPPLMHCVTAGSTPFRLNLHVRDLGHTLMFGPTGAGKSTHLALLAAQLRRYPNMSLYVFDKGMSMYPLLAGIQAATGGRSGRHLNIGWEGERLALAPLQYLEARGDQAWAVEWLDMVLSLSGVQTSPAQRNEIAAAVRNMQRTGSSSLTDFVYTVQDNQLREALEPYTVRGTMGHLLDGEQDGLSLADFTVFEIEELMGLGDRYALPVLWYLFRRIERTLLGQPAAILLDEAWLMLGHPVFREKLREWLKVLRKSNCLVLMATQSLSDAANSGILDVLLESCATKIFLPNAHAREESSAALYERMGLNERQIDIIANAVPKKEYYLVSDQGRRLYELALGPLALALCGGASKEEIGRIQALQRRYGHGWLEHFLGSRGLDWRGLASRPLQRIQGGLS